MKTADVHFLTLIRLACILQPTFTIILEYGSTAAGLILSRSS